MSGGADAAEGVRARLARFIDMVESSRKSMHREAAPTMAEMEAMEREAGRLREELERSIAAAGTDAYPDNVRMEIIGMAARARTGIRMLARLAAGGARYAALVREAGREQKGRLYDHDGKSSPSGQGSGLERRI